MNKTGLIHAMERIDYQYDDFGSRLESLIAVLCEDIKSQNLIDKNLDGNAVVGKIEKLIFDRTGITVKLVTNKHLAAIMPFYSNKNHIFLSDFLRGNLNMRDQNKVINAFGTRKGWVDVKKAKVGGIFSDYKHPLYFNFSKMITALDLTPAEMTGAMLHEIGHGFNACYYSDRSDQTNQVMATIFRAVVAPDAKTTTDYVYAEVQKVTDQITKEEVDRILHGPKIIAGATWFRAVTKMVGSQCRNDKYSETSFEEVADNFATRFGYGKQLAMTLEKIHDNSPEKRKNLLYFVYVLDFAIIAVYAALIIGAFMTGAVGFAVFAAIVNIAMFTASGDDAADMTYDTLKNRYKRIRQDSIDILKDLELPNEDLKNILDGIYAMDDAIKSSYEFRSIYDRLANFVFSASRDAKYNVELQQAFETLASNDLFIRAAEIKQQAN